MMDWGTTNEVNAVATVVGKILPVLEPGLKFYEEGCLTIEGDDGNVFMVVYPDGSLRRSRTLDTTEVSIEIKCPTRNVHIEFPERYYLQCQAEIQTLNVDRLLYISWTEEDTTVFKVDRDDDIFNKAMKLAVDMYGAPKPKKPTKLEENSKCLKIELKRKAKSVPIIGRFESCKQIENSRSNDYDTTEKTNQNSINLLEDINQCFKEHYELLRKEATEAVVFLLADLDRSWKRDTIRCSPIAWFPKGYSLDSETMRNISEEMHTKCSENGVHVPCESFDGQWHVLVVRSTTGEPPTIFQLQKDVWKETEKTSKSNIIAELKSLNRNAIVLNIQTCQEDNQIPQKCLSATNGGIKLPQYRKIRENVINDNDKTQEVTEENTLADTVADDVCVATGITQEDLSTSHLNTLIGLEVFQSNVNEEHWCQEREEIEETVEEIQVDTEHDKNILNTATVSESILTMSDMECILSLLKTTKDSNKKGKWNESSEEQLLSFFTSVKNLNKCLETELRVIIRYLRKTNGLSGTKESDTKAMKIKGIASLLGWSEELPNTTGKSKKSKKLKPLKDLALKVVSKYSKLELNVLMAEYKWQDAYKIWRGPIEDIAVNDELIEWFYKPEYSSVRKQNEVKCIDSTHLLTRMRRKSCRGGLDLLPNNSWMKVAKQKQTLLTPIMVEDVTDPMSVSMAKTHFSEAVEDEMRGNCDVDAANLCKDVRNWWESEDKSGISADDRINMRGPLRRRLISRVNFSRFPPATQYVGGWPQQLWEATIASIDAKAYLYGMVNSVTYNVRAFSSLIGETFFSELTLNDKRGQGTVTAKEFGEFISRSTEQLQIRLDPERTFSYCTSKSKVYEIVDETFEGPMKIDASTSSCSNRGEFITKQIHTRDHVFDKPSRKRLAGRKKMDHISTDRNSVLKGSLGVRWEKARANYSKMLPTKRMGLE